MIGFEAYFILMLVNLHWRSGYDYRRLCPMSIIQYVILFIVALNIGFASPANAENQPCSMNHDVMMQEQVKETSTSHDCCDEQLNSILSHDCDGECAQCQTHCHLTVVILPLTLNLSASINLQDIYLYHLPYYPNPTQSWLIPPIA